MVPTSLCPTCPDPTNPAETHYNQFDTTRSIIVHMPCLKEHKFLVLNIIFFSLKIFSFLLEEIKQKFHKNTKLEAINHTQTHDTDTFRP